MTYREFKQKQTDAHADLIDKYAFWAFNGEQFNAGKKKLNCENSELASIGGGGYMLKTEIDKLNELQCELNEEKKQYMRDDNFLLQAIKYELGNYEFIITGDEKEIIDILELDMEDQRVRKIFNQAINEYMGEEEN